MRVCGLRHNDSSCSWSAHFNFFDLNAAGIDPLRPQGPRGRAGACFGPACGCRPGLQSLLKIRLRSRSFSRVQGAALANVAFCFSILELTRPCWHLLEQVSAIPSIKCKDRAGMSVERWYCRVIVWRRFCHQNRDAYTLRCKAAALRSAARRPSQANAAASISACGVYLGTRSHCPSTVVNLMMVVRDHLISRRCRAGAMRVFGGESVGGCGGGSGSSICRPDRAHSAVECGVTNGSSFLSAIVGAAFGFRDTIAAR